MNIQISAPYQPCVYHCPFCVARGHKHEYKFDNLYGRDEEAYIRALRDFIIKYTKTISNKIQIKENNLHLKTKKNIDHKAFTNNCK